MTTAKYIIANGNAIIFSEALLHKDMVPNGSKAESAGFVQFAAETDRRGVVKLTSKCSGHSISLGLNSNPERDERLINFQILSLSNTVSEWKRADEILNNL